MTNEGVTIDISYYPGSAGGQVKQDENGYFYNSDDGRVLLTDDWYPDPEGTYRKFTHTPKGGCGVKEIKKGGVPASDKPGDGSSSSNKIKELLEEAYGGSGGSLLSYLGQTLGGTVVTGTLGFGGHKILAVLWPLLNRHDPSTSS
ncbi:hypothetical protein BEWA_051450 [Theileria equi strain WA]|uniref:Uncharacterized protein n=1 Tax=Theileria equi strain WA TaxID=1537102 RepID=L1LD39_THEEQ|nr:hypothetical protein BEWA_051450 [Theileria equi strain WA]EKX73093.1 hypothetical protein BEWA_051450 [Theileria equi strain WA]|eukprot:XP_004832545.1 hypothetical protein BEWA_051450 [Theileria equi strain WA]